MDNGPDTVNKKTNGPEQDEEDGNKIKYVFHGC